MSNLSIPTETIELPSKGLVYPESSPLSSGEVEMKYMTAKEEDILTNQSLIEKGTVLDKLLESLTLNKIKISELVPGDKNALLIAARILGYGAKYKFTWKGEEHEYDLSTLDPIPFDDSNLTEKGKNEFKFTLPQSGLEVTYKLLTASDEFNIQREIDGLKKLNKDNSAELTTRLKYMLLSVDGNNDKKVIRDFVDNMRVLDSKALRDHIKETQPNVNTKIILDNGDEIDLPITLSFFWPD